MQGDLAPARALTEEPTGKYLKALVGMAALFVALNDKERALSALEKGCDERSAGIVYVKVDEHFAPYATSRGSRRSLRANAPELTYALVTFTAVP